MGFLLESRLSYSLIFLDGNTDSAKVPDEVFVVHEELGDLRRLSATRLPADLTNVFICRSIFGSDCDLPINKTTGWGFPARLFPRSGIVWYSLGLAPGYQRISWRCIILEK